MCKFHTSDITVQNKFRKNVVFAVEKCQTKLQNAMCQQILTFIIDTESENHIALKTYYAL